MLHISDQYRRAYGDFFVGRFAEKGRAIQFTDSFGRDEVDSCSHFMRLKRSGADFIYFVGLSAQVPVILQQVREIHLELPLFSNLILASSDVYRGRENLMEGTYFTAPAYYESVDKRLRVLGKI